MHAFYFCLVLGILVPGCVDRPAESAEQVSQKADRAFARAQPYLEKALAFSALAPVAERAIAAFRAQDYAVAFSATSDVLSGLKLEGVKVPPAVTSAVTVAALTSAVAQ